MDPDQTAFIGAVCSGSTLFASILNSSVMLGNYSQQTTSADDIFRCIFFLGAFRVKWCSTGWSIVAHFYMLTGYNSNIYIPTAGAPCIVPEGGLNVGSFIQFR